MKNYPLLSIFLFICISVFFYQCDLLRGACEEAICLNGSECDSGDCICKKGYQGTDCGTEWRERYVGQYKLLFTCTNGLKTEDLNAEILADPNDVTGIILKQFDTGLNVFLENEEDQFNLDPQIFGSVTYQGKGVIESNGLVLMFTNDDFGRTCTWEYEPK